MNIFCTKFKGGAFSYLPIPPPGQDMTQGQFLSRVLNSEFSFSYYLPIAGGRIIAFIPFPRVLVLCEMQSVSSRIWTLVAMSISYDDNHYTTALLLLFIAIQILGFYSVFVCLFFGCVLWHVNLYGLFNAKSCACIYIYVCVCVCSIIVRKRYTVK